MLKQQALECGVAVKEFLEASAMAKHTKHLKAFHAFIKNAEVVDPEILYGITLVDSKHLNYLCYQNPVLKTYVKNLDENNVREPVCADGVTLGITSNVVTTQDQYRLQTVEALDLWKSHVKDPSNPLYRLAVCDWLTLTGCASLTQGDLWLEAHSNMETYALMSLMRLDYSVAEENLKNVIRNSKGFKKGSLKLLANRQTPCL